MLSKLLTILRYRSPMMILQLNNNPIILAIVLSLISVGGQQSAVAQASQPIIIGLDADMSGPSAEAGIAIQRGAELAIAEINAQGGVLARPLALLVKDHRGNPARGLDNIKALTAMPDLVAVLAGKHSPVALRQLETIQDRQIPFLVPWAAATRLVSNDHSPNYVFRVSVRDEDAGGFLVDEALRRGFKKPALILERTPWGRSNDIAINTALAARGISPVEVIWMNRGERDAADLIREAKDQGADVILLVASTSEAVTLVSDMASFPGQDRLPIISHWSVTGGVFFERSKTLLGQVDLTFLQTYSFITPPFPDRAERVIAAYDARYGAPEGARSLAAPVGIAHAYDLVHLLAKAIRDAGSIQGPDVRKALLNIRDHQGLLRDYAPPFTMERQDALNRDDFILGRYASDGAIIPQGN